MPDYTGSASTIRSRANYHAQVWACTPPQTVVLAGTLTATPSFPATSLSYSGTGGSYTNVQADQRVVFYDSTGVRKGETRIRFMASVTSTSLPVAETSANTINFASGDTFVVYEQWNIQDRLVSATDQFNKDTLITVGSYASDMPPVANGGGPRAGFFDAGQTYTTHQHDASTSYVVDPDSSSFTVLWDVIDGTIVSGSTTTNAITVQYPAGERWIKLTVTDSGNGLSTVKRIPVWSFDPAGTLPMRVTHLSLASAVRDGWSGEIEIARESAPTLTNLPDGALIVLFEQAYYGSAQVSYRSAITGGSNILATLFLESETIAFQPGSGTVTFRAESPLAVLKRTPALPQLMISGSTADWQHLKHLTVNRALWYIAFWHATVMEVCDFVWVASTNIYSYQRIAVENIDSIAGQLADVASSINADPTCDALGRVLVVRNPNYLDDSERAALVTTWNLTVADITGISMNRQHHGAVKHVRGEGINGANAPLFSNAGNAPSPIGTGSETLARQIIVTQSELNARTGRHFALLNGLYNGQFVPQGVSVDVPDGYAIFDPALREWVTLTLASTTNDRAVSFTTGTRWTVDAISIEFDGDSGGRDVQIVISHETDSAPGVSYFPPSSAGNGIGNVNLPNTDYPVLPYTPPTGLPATNLYKGTQRIAAICDNGIGLSTNYGSADLTTYAYTAYGSMSTPITGTVLQWVPDGFNPGSGWIVTTTKVYYGALSTLSFTLKYTFASSCTIRCADASFAESGFFSVVSYYSGGGGTKSLSTKDNFSTTVSGGEVTINSAATSTGGSVGIYVSSKTPGMIVAGAFTGLNASNAYVSSDYGATWAAASPAYVSSVLGFVHIHAPWAGNASDNIFYYASALDFLGNTGSHRFYRRTAGTNVQIAPTYAGRNHMPYSSSRYSEATSTVNPDRLALVGLDAGPVNGYGVFRSDNARATTPAWVTLVAPPSAYRGLAIAGDNQDVFYLFGTLGLMALSADAGVTIVDQSGNLPSATPGTVLAIAGY